MLSFAFLASSSVSKSMNPISREVFFSLSMTTMQAKIVPNLSKRATRFDSLNSFGNPAIKILV